LAVKLGFDGIDINIGCPDRKVLKQGAGSELIKNPKLAVGIIQAVKKGCDKKLPVSVKTRIGYSKKDFNHILAVAKEGVNAIAVHGRTVKQGYGGEADWEAIEETARLVKKINPKTMVIGNGDVKNREQAGEFQKKYGVDGIMIGRAALHNPWVFSGKKNVSLKTRLKTALKHTELFEKHHGNEANIGAMKKYYKGYFSGVAGNLFPKKELMESKNVDEAKMILESQIINHK